MSGASWRRRCGRALFADARLDLAKTTDLAIVPDGWLWYLPFEALVPPADKKGADRMAGAAAVRC